MPSRLASNWAMVVGEGGLALGLAGPVGVGQEVVDGVRAGLALRVAVDVVHERARVGQQVHGLLGRVGLEALEGERLGELPATSCAAAPRED